MMPDATQIAKVRQAAESARLSNRPLTISDQEQVKAIIQACTEILRIAAPAVDAFRLDLMAELRTGSRRALLARGVKDLKILAQTEAGRLREFLELEGLKPPDNIDQWPVIAARWVNQIEAGNIAPEVAPDDQPPKPAEVDPAYALTEVSGIGEATAQALQALGIHDLYDLAAMEPSLIRQFVDNTPSIKTRARVEDWPAKAQQVLDKIYGENEPGFEGDE